MTGAPAVLRFARDRRGYENFYLVQPFSGRRGKSQSRILYWFRTPPGVKVGRAPFDAATQRAIEARNPGVVFDWPRLIATPVPLPTTDVERWRERRRAEKAEKAARASREADLEAGASADVEEPDRDGEQPDEDASVSEEPVLEESPPPAEAQAGAESEEGATSEGSADVATGQPSGLAANPLSQSRRRRRRRRRHRHPQHGGPVHPGGNPGGSHAIPAESSREIQQAEPADDDSKTS